ncbi:MAG: gliding motility-associated C-terminal domain-containing protein, partial [Porphyrobacter sp. IPPAS B-1204]
SDTINGVAASPSNAILSVAPGSSVPAGLTFNTANGNVDVAPGTPAGTYSFDYQICEALNPTNCQTATITVTVEAAQITADPDTVAGVNGADGGPNVLNVLDGDTLNGNPVTLNEVTLTVTTPANPAAPGAPVPTLDPGTGLVSVPAGTPAGTYTITYQICEQLNPTNCATNTATVTVAPSPILASDDSATGINGADGGTGVVNAFASDTINGVAASPSNAILSVAPGSSVPAGLTFNTANGNVDVAPGTPAGTYSFDYQICEALNPTNCQTATITVTVEAAQITADPDTVAGVNGADGGPNVLNVLDGDTLNGNPVTLNEVTLTVTTPANPAAPGAPVPTLDPGTGLVSVPAGTPAGT